MNEKTTQNETNTALARTPGRRRGAVHRLIPGNQLLPYQRRWVDDQARWKFGLMARQVGKDFASGFEGMAECALAESKGRKIDWLIAAPSERQSLESLERWKE